MDSLIYSQLLRATQRKSLAGSPIWKLCFKCGGKTEQGPENMIGRFPRTQKHAQRVVRSRITV